MLVTIQMWKIWMIHTKNWKRFNSIQLFTWKLYINLHEANIKSDCFHILWQIYNSNLISVKLFLLMQLTLINTDFDVQGACRSWLLHDTLSSLLMRSAAFEKDKKRVNYCKGLKLITQAVNLGRYTMCKLIYPCVQIRSRLPGTVWRGLIFFMTDRPHYILKCPHFPGTITAEWFWLCVRSLCHQISRMRTFDENSYAISITSPKSLSSPRTQHVSTHILHT